ncbi:hypothetical protein AAE478_005963 [Parahypoxylon ruwenzoriense]
MSANNDNAMTRFLFAILRQKNLKDIDWNKVAHDPILAQEITNGHAARMRYSRFKSAMLGIEPTRRNRTGAAKSRVTKSKKDAKEKRDEHVKSEPTPEPRTSPRPLEMTSPKIKQEALQHSFESRLTPGLTPGPTSMSNASTVPNTPSMIQPRFLTPCSDIDVFSRSPTLSPGPISEIVGSQQSPHSFEFHGMRCADNADPMWSHAPAYTTFAAAAYPYDDYGAGSCEHPHMHHSPHLGLLNHSIESDADYVVVKHEEWDERH